MRDVDIRVYWDDPVTGERKSGILWDYIWIDSIIHGTTDKEIEARLYEWDVKGDDGHWYTFPETELSLDRAIN